MIGSPGLLTAVDGLKNRVGYSGGCAPGRRTLRRPGPIATTLLAAVGLRSLTDDRATGDAPAAGLSAWSSPSSGWIRSPSSDPCCTRLLRAKRTNFIL